MWAGLSCFLSSGDGYVRELLELQQRCERPFGSSSGSFTPLLLLKKFPDIPVSTREETRESRPPPEEPRFCLLAREEVSLPCVVGKEFPVFPSHLKRRRSPQERREKLQGCAPFPESLRCLSPFQGNLFSLHCLDFQDEDRLTPRWHDPGVPLAFPVESASS